MSEEITAYKPIAFTPGAQTETGWEFHGLNRSLDIDAYQDEINQVLLLANGLNNVAEIIKALGERGVDPELCAAIIDDLSQAGILGDSRDQHLRLHDISKNPSAYFREMSPQDISQITVNDSFTPRIGERYQLDPLAATLEGKASNRVSCRSFNDQPVTLGVLSSVLRFAYSQDLRPVPSAGALYPLRLYVANRRDTPELPQGLYQYDHTQDTLIGYGKDMNEDRIKFALNSETFIFNASVVLMIAADIKRHSTKYANRGYRYSLIEAGHAAQNMHLALQDRGVSSVEYGGFSDDILAEEFELLSDESPLITIGAGYPSTKELVTGLDLSDRLSVLVGKDRPVEWVGVDFESAATKKAGFYFAMAKFRRPNDAYGSEEHQYSGGTALSIQLACVKAIAEAYERYQGGQLRSDINAPATALDTPWLDPRKVRPLSDEQIEKNPHLGKFSETEQVQWVKAKHYPTQEEWHVPVDLAFYPLNEAMLGRKPFAEADSSGMAAHTDLDTAIRKATLELIERDAIMRSWFSQEPNNRLSHDILPTSIQQKISEWKLLNRHVDVIDLSHDNVIIINVIIHSEDGSYPFFVNGAAASDVSFEEAIDKAFNEAELGLIEAQNSQPVQVIEPEDVRSPADHGKLYLYDTHRSNIEWLWSGPIIQTLPKPPHEVDIIRQFKPIVLQYTLDDSPLYVVRAFCPQLVPINFGFGNEHHTHSAVPGKNQKIAQLPHYFA